MVTSSATNLPSGCDKPSFNPQVRERWSKTERKRYASEGASFLWSSAEMHDKFYESRGKSYSTINIYDDDSFIFGPFVPLMHFFARILAQPLEMPLYQRNSQCYEACGKCPTK